jgi:hypothetical protein
MLISDHQWSLKKRVKFRIEVVEGLKDICLKGDEQAITKVGFTLTPIQ